MGKLNGPLVKSLMVALKSERPKTKVASMKVPCVNLRGWGNCWLSTGSAPKTNKSENSSADGLHTRRRWLLVLARLVFLPLPLLNAQPCVVYLPRENTMTLEINHCFFDCAWVDPSESPWAQKSTPSARPFACF